MGDDSYFGFQGLTEGNGHYNADNFAIRQELQRVRTNMLVKIMEVVPDKDDPISNGPMVHVMPLVNQIDGQGNATDHGMIYNLPIVRHQAGDAVFINDPVVGDIGTISVHDRDISAVKSSSQKSNPGSFRRHDAADGIYHFATLNKTKIKRYVMPNGDGGWDMVDANGNKFSMGSKGVNINGLIIDTHGNLITPGGIQAGTGSGDSVTLQHHVHQGSPPPTPGT